MHYKATSKTVIDKMEHINNLKEKLEKLQDTKAELEDQYIEFTEYQDRLKAIETELSKLLEEKQMVSTKLSDLQAHYNKNSYSEVCDKIKSIVPIIKSEEEKLGKLKAQEFNNCMSCMNKSNTMNIRLSKQTRTTGLLDKFCKSAENKFLVIDFKLHSPEYKGIIKLVVTRYY